MDLAKMLFNNRTIKRRRRSRRRSRRREESAGRAYHGCISGNNSHAIFAHIHRHRRRRLNTQQDLRHAHYADGALLILLCVSLVLQN